MEISLWGLAALILGMLFAGLLLGWKLGNAGDSQSEGVTPPSEKKLQKFKKRIVKLTKSRARLCNQIAVLESEVEGPTATEVPLDASEGYALEEIFGIGEGYRSRLADFGISNSESLADLQVDSGKSKEIAGALSVDLEEVERWARMADLLRVAGVRGQFALLLESTGIGSIEDLATRDATELAKELSAKNARIGVTKTTPSPITLAMWISTARELSAKVGNS